MKQPVLLQNIVSTPSERINCLQSELQVIFPKIVVYIIYHFHGIFKTHIAGQDISQWHKHLLDNCEVISLIPSIKKNKQKRKGKAKTHIGT